MNSLRYILFLFFTLFAICKITDASNIDDIIEKKAKLSSAELIKNAEKFIYQENKPDSALFYYSIVSNRYSEKISDSDKELSIEAFIGKWYIYFFHYFEYNKSYESLLKAKEIADAINKNRSKIDLNFGCMFQTIAEQLNDYRMKDVAYSHFVKAVENSMTEHDEATLNMSFTNLLYIASDLKRLDSIKYLKEKYETYPFKNIISLIEYNKILYNAVTKTEAKDYEGALKCYEKQIEIIKNKKGHVRFLLAIYIAQTDIYIKMNDVSMASKIINEILNISHEHNTKDAELIAYELYTNLYRHTGDYDNLEECREKYYTLKDSLLNYQKITSMNQMHFLNKIKAIDDKFQKLKMEKEMQEKMFYLVCIILLLVVVCTITILINYRQLKKKNIELFNKNVKLIKSEDKQKAIRKKYEGIKEADFKEDLSDTDVKLSEEEEILLKDILNVMDNTETICSYNFTIEKLSELVNSKKRFVSEIINKVYDCNFNTFIGEYRIKESCRRLIDNDNYGNMTIEAIGNSVGFKSRSNFIITFKKFTGLTPSKYKQLSEKQ